MTGSFTPFRVAAKLSGFPRLGRMLRDGQTSELVIIHLDGTLRVVLVADEIIEAPNWTPDGKWLVFNAGGRLFRIGPDGAGLSQIDSGSIGTFNNDHVISPDGRTIYGSADGHIYAVPFGGGVPQRVSNEHPGLFRYYLHGVSPDGDRLAYVAIEPGERGHRANIFTIPSRGGDDQRLTDVEAPNDGPEYSPDGLWIYFNSELAARRPGDAQIFRMDARNGGSLQQLTFDDAVNWFPHLSPDGRHVSLISYPTGVVGHPADEAVELRVMSPDGAQLRTLATFNGGQGSLNVNSWAPDSLRLAFVRYPIPTPIRP